MGPQLETPRLILRDLRDDDLDAFNAMNGDPRVREFFPSVEGIVASTARFERLRARFADEPFGWWAVEVRGGPSFAGMIALQNIPFEAHFTPAMEVGWHFAYDAWHHGYATEGARAALGYAFDVLGCNEVVAITAAVNRRSMRVMERLGMWRDAADDFAHPSIEPGHRLNGHVLYRLTPARFSQSLALAAGMTR